MSHEELAWKSYESARQEFVERIRSRDTILFGSLATLGAVFGYALKEKNAAVLLVVPYLSVGFLGLIFHHHQTIRAITVFIVKDLLPSLDRAGVRWPVWDNSDELFSYLPVSNRMRTTGYALLLNLPCVATCIVTWRLVADLSWRCRWLPCIWTTGVVAALVSLAMTAANHLGLEKMLRKIRPQAG